LHGQTSPHFLGDVQKVKPKCPLSTVVPFTRNIVGASRTCLVPNFSDPDELSSNFVIRYIGMSPENASYKVWALFNREFNDGTNSRYLFIVAFVSRHSNDDD